MSILLDALLEEKLITKEQLDDARDKQLGAKKPLHELLVDMGFLQEEKLIAVASKVFNLEVVHLDNEMIDATILNMLPYNHAKRFGIFPLRKEEGKLVVAMGDAQEILILDDVRLITGMDIKPVLSTKSDISRYIEKYYLLDDSTYDLMKNIVEDTKVELIQDIKPSEDQFDVEFSSKERSPVIQLANLILGEAVKSRASDIHIEPFEEFTEVRYRIDGFLKNIMKLPKKLSNPLVARIKILSELDIAETRKPQDGRSKVMVNNKKIDLRVSIVPAFHGEKVVIRVLDTSHSRVKLDNIGFKEDELSLFKEVIRKPQGMILITGPTGSGKTSTIYAALDAVKNETVNIITVEDPVEYLIEGINQIQVNPVKDVTFANGLRSILRQDPNVILVGEIRDFETAEIAFRSSLTGHLVFSTLHTNNAIATILRLKDMGLDSYIVGSSLIFIVAQRLVRVICPHCKELYQPSENTMNKFKSFIERLGISQFYKGKGCDKCGYVGFLGRIAIFEMLKITDKIRELISSDASEPVILEEARKNKFKNLAESGVIKVLEGITTLEEVARVTDAVDQDEILAQKSGEQKGIKILLVDDEDDIRKVISKRLQNVGYIVVQAKDGLEALECVFNEKPDLILMDIMMPRMDGFEATKKLRSHLQTASIPIIMLTAKKDKQSELDGIDVGADDYITKPFDNDKLLSRIKMLLRRNR